MFDISPEMEELYNELVPSYGPAKTHGGEIIRAFNKLGYRFLNDGDHVGRYYGNETCNCAARFVHDNVPPAHDIIRDMWGEENDGVYSDYLQDLQYIVARYVADDMDGTMKDRNDDDFLNYRIDADDHDFVDFYGEWEDEEDDYWDDEDEW